MAFIIRHPIRKGVFLLVSLYAVLALLTLRAGDRRLYPAPSEKVAVYVINNGFHTDIALPADAVAAHGGLLAAAANHAGADSGAGKWLVYGWGDAGFFTGHGMSFGRVLDGLRALFHPGNPSVIRVFSVSMAPDRAYGKNTASRIFLTKDGFETMASHIEASFAARNGAPVMTGLPSEAVFFASREHFSILRVCNNWTSDQLAAAGLPTAPMLDGNALLLGLDLRWRAGVKPAD